MPKETKSESEIEKAYPEAYRLARKFHELYEYYASGFGYETSEETKEFKPSSPNGRLMAYVCNEIVKEELSSQRQKDRESLVEMVRGLKKTKTFPQSLNRFDGNVEYFERLSDSDIHYNQALADLEQAIINNFK